MLISRVEGGQYNDNTDYNLASNIFYYFFNKQTFLNKDALNWSKVTLLQKL